MDVALSTSEVKRIDPAHRAAPRLRITELNKSFGGLAAVRNVSLSVTKGEFFCLLGRSGCGKTTFLRLIAGLECADRGRVEVDGIDITGKAPHVRPVNLMFQSYALFPHMTVAQNIAFGLEQDQLKKAEVRQRVAEAMDMLAITTLGSRRPGAISGGEQQRVALARCLVKRPKLLLLDEPLGALDPGIREHTRQELRALHKRLGMTFVVVTHDREEALSLGSRIALMDQGAIVQTGPPATIFRQPKTRRAAEFFGAINHLEGQIIGEGPDAFCMAANAKGEKFCVTKGQRIPTGSRCWIVLRPEDIKLCRDQPPSGNNRTEGRVHDIAFAGTHFVYRIRLASGQLISVSEPIQESSSADRASPRFADKEQIKLHWPWTKGTLVSS